MRILVTNDDSINAPGLWAVAESLTELGQVYVVAPDRDQSGIGTARTLLNILRVNEVEPKVPGVPAYTVSGTPSDCVILATSTLFDEPFDLVVSGINEGPTWVWTCWTRERRAALSGDTIAASLRSRFQSRQSPVSGTIPRRESRAAWRGRWTASGGHWSIT